MTHRKQFAEHTDKVEKGITFLYLPAQDVLIEPSHIEVFPRITNTLQIHMIKQFFVEQNVSRLQFFKIAIEEKPFFIQFYGEGACSHQKTVTDENHCVLCLVQYVRFGSIATAFLIDNAILN